MDAAFLFHVGSILTGVVFAGAFLLLERRRHSGWAGLGAWMAAAFALDATSSAVAITPGLNAATAGFLFAGLHALVPVMILAGVSMPGARERRLWVLLLLAVLVLGWIGGAMVATMSIVWVMLPVHVFRGAVFLSAAWTARASAGPGNSLLAWVCAAQALFALAVAGVFLNGAETVLFFGAAEKCLMSGLGLAALLTVIRTKEADQDLGTARRSPNDSALVEALDIGILWIDPDGSVTGSNHRARRLFEADGASDILGRSLVVLFPGLEDKRQGLNDLPIIRAEDLSVEVHGSTVRARTLRGTDLWLDVARLPVPGHMRGTGDQAREETALVLRVGGPASMTDVARLSLDLDSQYLSGASVPTLCRMVCLRFADMETEPLVWVALTNAKAKGQTELVAMAGPEAGTLKEVAHVPLPDSLSSEVEAAMQLKTVRVIAWPPHDGEATLFPPEAGPPSQVGEARFPSAEGAACVGLFPLVSGDRTLGVLAIHGHARHLGRATRQRGEVVARRLANTLRLHHDIDFLRLQAGAMAVAANAIFITDHMGRIEWANEAFTRLSGFSGDEVRGKTPHILFSGHQNPALYAEMWQTIDCGDVWRGELVERRKDGGLYTVQQTITPMRDDNDHVHYVAVHEDITEHKRAEERVRYLSNYDMLTRLPNRALFRDRLNQAVQQARRIDGTVAVLFIDLTQFSRVNDTLGHDIGDQILMTVGSRINAAVANEVDAFARIGGDEFAIAYSGVTGTDAAATLARQLSRIIQTPVEVSGHSVSLRATIGIAVYPDDGTDPDNLIKNADLAMHRVGKTDGEGFCFYSTEMNNEAQVRLALEADLRRALERDELINYYQPQYNMNGTLVGMEALVRWNHPERGLVPPGQFIAVAEESGLIMPLGEAVLHRALSDLALWRAHGLPIIPVAVNISAVQLRDGGLVDRIRAALDDRGLPTDALDLEITESVLMGEHAGAVTFLNRLADAGFHIAIDDFGTGYSSLSYLKRFPVHKLKIDQSFVRHVNEDTNDAILVRAIINLGHSLGMTVIAEGVETEDQFDSLRSEGADIVQGYLFSRPVPREEMEALLRVETGHITDTASA